MKSKKEMLNKRALLITLIAFSITFLITALTFIDNSQSDFDLGTYNQTEYNSTNNAVQINFSYNNRTYISQIFNTGSNVSFNNLSWEYQRIQCPAEMAYINKLNGFCIDKYEANCMYPNGTHCIPTSAGATDTALTLGALANSSFNQTVWVYIDQTEARTACSNAGKYLCTDEEWLASANLNGIYFNLPATLSASPYYCVIDSTTDCAGESPGSGNACKTGGCTDNEGCGNCVSSEGVYDMTGNVLEWTNETVGYTKPCNTASAGWCYFNGTDFQTGTDTNTAVYGNDGVYFLANTVSGYAVRRGGFWGDGANAGPFCAYLNAAPTYTSAVIGFRCCSS